MKLHIQLDAREHAILVCDDDNNDIAEFYHSDHATVDQSYETALMLARALILAAGAPEMFATMRAWMECPAERRPSPEALGMRVAEIAAKGIGMINKNAESMADIPSLCSQPATPTPQPPAVPPEAGGVS